MQPIVPITEDVLPTSVVPTNAAQQQQFHHQQAAMRPGGGTNGGGLQIPTSMEQMTAQATSLLKKIAPTPPTQPPQGPGKGTQPLLEENPAEVNTDLVIGGKRIMARAHESIRVMGTYFRNDTPMGDTTCMTLMKSNTKSFFSGAIDNAFQFSPDNSSTYVILVNPLRPPLRFMFNEIASVDETICEIMLVHAVFSFVWSSLCFSPRRSS